MIIMIYITPLRLSTLYCSNAYIISMKMYKITTPTLDIHTYMRILMIDSCHSLLTYFIEVHIGDICLPVEKHVTETLAPHHKVLH